MATRFYLPSSGAAAVSPAFGGAGAWEITTGASRFKLVRTRINSAMTSRVVNDAGTTTPATPDSLGHQYVSDPIVGNQTISGTLQGQIRAFENANAANARTQVRAYVVSNDGATVRGTLYAGDNRAAIADELTLATRNERVPAAGTTPPVAISSVAALDGDRIVVEMGAYFANSDLTAHSVTLSFGDNSIADLTVGGTETTANNPWVQFSADINFTALPPSVEMFIGGIPVI